jgi:DNA-binding transcriptional LysR family regulator
VADDVASGRLVRPFGPRMKSGLTYWFVTQKGAERRPEVRAFRDFVRVRVLGKKG